MALIAGLELSENPEVGGSRETLKDILREEIKHKLNPYLVFRKVVARAIKKEVGYYSDDVDRIFQDIKGIIDGDDDSRLLEFAAKWVVANREALRFIFEIVAKNSPDAPKKPKHKEVKCFLLD
ncbi:MAG: hypothetical protein PHO48_00645 [Candidatus Gracilibacteria bacterium]|nr:hypothetical protein [Candidatus Gracilibacteria bacterium]MDD5179256.1 hypothetical protein [Candidatus Gracilibacteria bacterium]